jgi:hypothetical protein
MVEAPLPNVLFLPDLMSLQAGKKPLASPTSAQQTCWLNFCVFIGCYCVYMRDCPYRLVPDFLRLERRFLYVYYAPLSHVKYCWRFTGEGAVLTVSSNLECNLGIICGSLPEIRPLLMRVIDRPTNTAPSEGYDHSRSRPQRTAQSYNSRPYDSERSKRNVNAISADSLHKFYQWAGVKDSMPHVRDSIALKELSTPKKSQLPVKRQSGTSDGQGSHGSEEMWISGAENAAHKKNLPGTALWTQWRIERSPYINPRANILHVPDSREALI